MLAASTSKDIVPIVFSVTQDVNKLSLEKQTKELENLAPELLVKEKKERDFTLPNLPDAEQERPGGRKSQPSSGQYRRP